MEDEHRVKNAKIRMSEKGRRVREESGMDQIDQKRRKLEQIEEEALAEENPDKLMELFEAYRTECQSIREETEENENKKRRLRGEEEEMTGVEAAEFVEKAGGSGDPVRLEEIEVGTVEMIEMERLVMTELEKMDINDVVATEWEVANKWKSMERDMENEV